MNTKVYEEKLKKEKADIEVELKKIPEVPNLGDDIEGEVFEEETDEAEEYVTDLGVKDSLKKRLQEINAALEKIGQGTYGKCKQCGGMISEDILNANPEARFCKDCKQQ